MHMFLITSSSDIRRCTLPVPLAGTRQPERLGEIADLLKLVFCSSNDLQKHDPKAAPRSLKISVDLPQPIAVTGWKSRAASSGTTSAR